MSNPEQGNLGWMYKGEDSTVDREEYLLGRAVDKAFECSEFGFNGQNEIEKSCLPQSIFESTGCNTQVDILRKKQEDPLEVIRQKEIEVRKQLLKNPIKLRKLQNQLKEQNHSKEKSMKKKKKKKREDSNDSDDDLDKKLADKYLKLIKKYGLEKLKNINDKSSSEYEGSSEEEEKRRNKDIKFKHNKSSDESSPLEGKSRGREYKDKRRDSHRSYKQGSRNYISTSDTDGVSSENELSKTSSRNKHYNEKKRHGFQGDRHLNKTKGHNSKRYHLSSYESSLVDKKKETNIKSKKEEMEEKGHSNRNYGLVVPENAPKSKKHSEKIVLKPEKFNKIETSNWKRPSKLNLSEDEKEKRRREMMQNAKWRDEVRNKNVKRYKKEEEEEEKKKEKNYDSDFLRKQIADVMSVHESVEERIRSNINNIQRTSIALDKKFTSK